MSNVVVSMFMTLDGIVENPMWTLDYWNEDIAAFKNEELFAAEAQLLGRVTYEEFVASWPQRSGDDFTDRFNSMPKYVASKTLTTAEWNASLLSGDVVTEIRKLKEKDGSDLIVYGSPTLVGTLMEHDLVDRYNILMYPLVLGAGKKLFEGDATAKLRLVKSKAHENGAVLLVYEPARQS